MNNVPQHRCGNPLVSVIVPALNAEGTIAAALDSILSQGYEHLEVIVVDDGSTDDTVLQIASLEDPRVSVLKGGGGGVSHARNVGVRAATGELIMFADSDDEIAPNSIVNSIALIEGFHADMVIGGVRKVWSDGRIVDYSIDSNEPVEFTGEGISSLIEATVGYSCKTDPRLNSSHLTGSWGRLVWRHQLEGLHFNESLPIGEDTVFNVALLKRCDRVVVTPDIWYRYRQNPSSAVYRYRENAFGEGAAMLTALKAELGDSFPEAFRRRTLLQLEGAVKQRIASGCPEKTIFRKAHAVREELCRGFWAIFLDSSPSIAGISVKHRCFLLAAKRRLAIALCLAMRISESKREKGMSIKMNNASED